MRQIQFVVPPAQLRPVGELIALLRFSWTYRRNVETRGRSEKCGRLNWVTWSLTFLRNLRVLKPCVQKYSIISGHLYIYFIYRNRCKMKLQIVTNLQAVKTETENKISGLH